MRSSGNLPETRQLCSSVDLELLEVIENGNAKTFVYRDVNEPGRQIGLMEILFYLSLLLMAIVAGVSAFVLFLVFRGI